MSTITIKKIVEGMKLTVLAGENGLLREVSNQNLAKPGVELAGMFDFFEKDRIQIIGSKESTFFHWLDKKDQEQRVRQLFEMNPPAFLFSKNVDVPELFKDLGNEFNIAILKSSHTTTSLFSELYAFLQEKLAARTTMHGVLMDINGVGVLITGKSGIGKSEVALELIRRGYILIADDIVEIYQLDKGVIIGEAPDVLKKFLEIRGVGIVNVVYLFGVKSYRENKRISLIVELQMRDNDSNFDRLGLREEHKTIIDSALAFAALPITEARNTATLVEAAAYDFKSKQMGYNSAREFNDCLNDQIKINSMKDEEDENE